MRWRWSTEEKTKKMIIIKNKQTNGKKRLAVSKQWGLSYLFSLRMHTRMFNNILQLKNYQLSLTVVYKSAESVGVHQSFSFL